MCCEYDTCGLYDKRFMIIIYNHNDSGLYHKTTILANLALARSIRYDHEACYELKYTFTIVSYDRKTIIVNY
jgi:hypothetical protein